MTTDLPERTHHSCFSGDVTCSGCDPCPACQRHVRACVLPVAVAAAGFDGSLLSDLHVLADVVRAAASRLEMHARRMDALGLRTEAAQLRKDAAALAVERAPLSAGALARTEEDQILRIMKGYDVGWQRLHESMTNVDTVRAEVVRTQVRGGGAAAVPARGPVEPAERGGDVSSAEVFDVFGDGTAIVARDVPLTADDVAASVEAVDDELGPPGDDPTPASPARVNGAAAEPS